MSDQQPDEYAYDVFISYSHDDAGWVRGTLLERLEDAGLNVCIDYRDFRPGAPSLKEMVRAANISHRTVLVLTPAYVKSEWTEFERLILQTKDPINKDLRLIPLLWEECELPDEIAYLNYVDLADPWDEQIAWTQLLTALGAAPEQEQPETPTRAGWHLAHPYPMPPNFTGRQAERQMLTEWLHEDDEHPLFVLRALGGFGKSALTWHWLLHDVGPTEWRSVVWWSFYETEARFESFLPSTLEYLGGDPSGLGPRQQADEILKHLQRHADRLLVLDGFERELRAYGGMSAAYQGDEPAQDDLPADQRDCVSIAAEHFLRSVATLPDVGSKVLMTTRMRPRVLEAHGNDLLQGCREEELTELHPDDAVAFFSAQGIRGSRAEIRRVAARYGYHPLSLRLLAGLIAEDFEQPGDIHAAEGLDISGDLKQRQHHVLEPSYAALTSNQQYLLSRIACFRGPVRLEAVRAAAGGGRDDPAGRLYDVDADLRILIRRGLLHGVRRDDTETTRYDLHPIVRRYAYGQLSDDRRRRAHEDLRDYFAAVPVPDSVQRLADLEPVIELYHHTVLAGEYDDACDVLYNLLVPKPLYFQFGAYELCIELLRPLFPDGENQLPCLKSEAGQAWVLNQLANSYSLSGRPRHAISLYKGYIAISQKHNDKINLAISLVALASGGYVPTGKLRDAETNLRKGIALCWETKDDINEAVGHAYFGWMLAFCGKWEESLARLHKARKMFQKRSNSFGIGFSWAHIAWRLVLLNRAKSEEAPLDQALSAAQQALKFASKWAKTQYPVERELVRAYWLLGAVHRVVGNHSKAKPHLKRALDRCRTINAVEAEADILLEFAKLRAAQGNREEALRLAEEARTITERSGYVLQGADVHLFLAEMARDAGDTPVALKHARKARELAYCDGPPDYTYKVAFDEAEGLLEELGDGV